MIPPGMQGLFYALLSAAAWGAGDFSGGYATRAQNQYRVLFLMTIPGIILLGLIALGTGERFPSVMDIFWASGAGVVGALGIAALYRGLSIGSSAVVAPTAAVIGAGVPVAFSALTLGLPEPQKMLGIFLAMSGIWLTSRHGDGHGAAGKAGLDHAVIAGLGFGAYFILVAQVRHELIFGPLVFAKTASLIVAAVIILAKGDRLPPLQGSPATFLAGVFDAGGNVFYMLARQYTRLDVAAVLAPCTLRSLFCWRHHTA
jgi:uncharacterized membrane protein